MVRRRHKALQVASVTRSPRRDRPAAMHPPIDLYPWPEYTQLAAIEGRRRMEYVALTVWPGKEAAGARRASLRMRAYGQRESATY